MRIRFTVEGYNVPVGEIVEVQDSLAENHVANGVAEKVRSRSKKNQDETASLEPKSEQAARKAPRKRGT